jgi:hypothetical protein
LAALGTAQREAAQPAYHDTLLQAATLAEEIADADALCGASLGFRFDVAATHPSDMKARRVIQAALDFVSADATPTRARLLAELTGTYDTGTEWNALRDISIQAIEMARQTDDETTFVQVLRTVYLSLMVPDRLDQLIRDIEAAAILADRSGDPALQFGIRLPLMWVVYEQTDAERADAVVAEMQRLADVIDLPAIRWQLGEYVSGRLLMRGKPDEADAANEQTLSLGVAAGVPAALVQYGAVLYTIRQQQGRRDEIADFLIEAVRDDPSLPALRSVLPAMLCELDRIDEARERFATETLLGFDYPYDATWLAAMANMTEAAASLREGEIAATLLARLEPFAAQPIVPAGLLSVGALSRPLARAASILGQYDRAEDWFASAHDLHARLQSPYWQARGQLDHADLCLARRGGGDLERARELASAAAATSGDYGCAGIAKRATALLAQL